MRLASIDKLLKRIERLEAENAALRAASGWRDIAELPKGTEALLYCPPEKRGGKDLEAMWRVGMAPGFPFRRASHWKPLPAAPASKAGGA